MGLQETPRGERIHIALFGKRNAGKSSIINALTNQETAIVSEQKGTTTDPVYKAMELLPLGPVVLIDTPGLDDEGELGKLRILKTREVLAKTDVALLVADSQTGISSFEEELLQEIKQRKIPVFLILNKIDLVDKESRICAKKLETDYRVPVILTSATEKKGMERIKELLGTVTGKGEKTKRIIGDLIEPFDFVLLVIPIDEAAPKGRLILPQQQTIRDILDSNGISIVVKETELSKTLEKLGTKPKLVITDSQVFEKVTKEIPKEIPLTSFSILFARYKGNLKKLVENVTEIDRLQDGDKILMAEGCTHHRQCGDIGTVKLPNWILSYSGKKLIFETCSGSSFPQDLTSYAMVVHCGGCMLNEKEMRYRMMQAGEQKVPIVNYGILIAYLNGILERSLEPFPEIAEVLPKKPH